MKKAGSFLGLFFAVCLLLAGCGEKEKPENGYNVYYINPTGMGLVENRYSPSAQTFDELMRELQDQMKQAPSNCKSALEGKVKIKGYVRGIDALRIDFSKEYYGLGNTAEVLLRAATVKTFSQIPGVTKIMITVEGEQLKDTQGQPVPAMDADSFIDTKEGGINSYLYAKLALYFPDSGGEKLDEELRSLHYSSNMVLERVVIEQLIAGPQSSKLRPIFTNSVKIQNLYIKNGVCTINFDREVNKIPAEGSVPPEVAVYAIVNSICETCDDITEVRFEIEGDNTVKFRDVVKLDQGFTANLDYIEQEEQSAEAKIETEAQTETVTEEGAGEQKQAASARPSEADTEAVQAETRETAAEKPEKESGARETDAEDKDSASSDSSEGKKTAQGGAVIGVDPSLTSKEKRETQTEESSTKE